MSGFVVIHRSLWDHPVFRDGVEAAAFAWMISQAAWRPTRVRYKARMICLGRGQLAVSVRDLARRFGWSEPTARRFLNRLKTDAMIDTSSDAGVSVITICNYRKFQDVPQAGDAPDDAERDAAPTQHRRTEQTSEQGNKGREQLSSLRSDSAPALLEAEPAQQPEPDECEAAVAEYNALAETVGIPRVQKLSKARRAKLRARLSDAGGLEGWRCALAKIRGSPFLRGERRDWSASFDFLLQEESFIRLMEGKYDDRQPAQQDQAARATERRGSIAAALAERYPDFASAG